MIRATDQLTTSGPTDSILRTKKAEDTCGSAEERVFDQERLTSQPRDLTVCRFRLRGRRLSGNVVALARCALVARYGGRLLRIGVQRILHRAAPLCPARAEAKSFSRSATCAAGFMAS